MGSPKTRPAIMKVLVKTNGKPVTLEDLMKATGFSATQVQSQMRNLIKYGYPVEVLDKAQMWKYTGDVEPVPATDERAVTDMVFEGIGRTASGAILARDVDGGTLYVLRELDI